MYLTVHAAAGILIGSYVNKPLASFILAIISHFILDLVPHNDGDIPTKGQSIKTLRKFYFNKIFALIYLDICLSIVVAVILLTNNIHLLSRSIIWGMVGSILPDIFLILSFFWRKNRLLHKFNELHNFLHYSPEKPISMVSGHLTQLVTLLLLIKPLV